MKAKTVTLGSIATITSGGTPDRQRLEYWGGNIPWVKTTLIQNCEIKREDIDETITEEGLKKSSAKIIPAGSILMAMIGQGKTRGQVALLNSNAAINQNGAALILNDGIDARYVYQQLLFRYDELRNASNSSGQQNLNAALIRSFRIPRVAANQQPLIGTLLKEWDSAIEKAEHLVAAKSRQLSQFRERLVGRGSSKQTRLREATRESLARNGSTLGRNQIMGVTNDCGMRPMREETIAASIDRYKIVRPRAFAYNPMRLNVGSIAISAFERDVLVSPDYVVFECDESKLLASYLNHLRFTRHWKSYFDVAGSGSVRVRIYYDDLAALTIPLPPIEQQHRAVAILDTAAAEIDCLVKYSGALRRQKRGLMQKLLTGKWRLPLPEPEAA